MKKQAYLAAVFTLTACGAPSSSSPFTAAPNPDLSQTTAAAPGPVTRFFIKGHTLEVATGKAPAQALFLKGVDYAPTPICSTYLESPLANDSSPIWKRDLPILRNLGVNAIKIYNTNANAAMNNFLKAAYNNGKKPIYTILSIRFNPDIPLNADAVADLSRQYRTLAKNNGADPDVIGISIGSEVNAENLIGNPNWWAGMSQLASAAKDGFRQAGHAEKIITTTMVDDGFETEKAGEKYGFPIDAWGVNFYRGDTFGNAFAQYAKISKKPLIVSEYGTPVGWHPGGVFEDVKEFPKNKVDMVTSYVKGLAKELYQNSNVKKGIVSGGFYFEYSDEWYKSDGDPCQHLPGPSPKQNPKFVGLYDDEGWFGLNLVSNGNPNKLTQRPAFTALKTVFANQ